MSGCYINCFGGPIGAPHIRKYWRIVSDLQHIEREMLTWGEVLCFQYEETLRVLARLVVSLRPNSEILWSSTQNDFYLSSRFSTSILEYEGFSICKARVAFIAS